MYVNMELYRGELYEIKLEEKIPSRRIGIATLMDVPLPVVAGKFIEMLE